MTSPVFHKPNSVIYKNRVFVRPKGVSGTLGSANSGGLNRRASSESSRSKVCTGGFGSKPKVSGFLEPPGSFGKKSLSDGWEDRCG